jgi:hypothetical protein
MEMRLSSVQPVFEARAESKKEDFAFDRIEDTAPFSRQRLQGFCQFLQIHGFGQVAQRAFVERLFDRAYGGICGHHEDL